MKYLLAKNELGHCPWRALKFFPTVYNQEPGTVFPGKLSANDESFLLSDERQVLHFFPDISYG